MWAVRDPAAHDRKLLLLLLGTLIALAWVILWAWGQSPYARFLDHQQLTHMRADGLWLLAVFVAGWVLMTVAMMLPTSLPLVLLFQRLVGWRADHMLLMALLLVGYLSVWTLFGALAFLGDGVLHRVAEQVGWLHANAWVIGAATLIGAGLYQFSPLKYHCLEKCRSPMSFITEHWRGRHEAAQAFALGLHHGLFCLGCCWLLMLLMFLVGMGSLGWMLALGTVMAVEKNFPWGRRLSTPLGVALLGAGLTVPLLAWLR